MLYWLRTVFLGDTLVLVAGEDERQAGPTLRERRRTDLLAQIKDVARDHLGTGGAASLSLRAVARDIGIAVSALYRYYPSRDDLLTELLVDAFTEQADAVDEAVDRVLRRRPGDTAAALRSGFAAYRRWSVEHPAEFGLCYGTPVPGYAAPPERTVRAATRVGDRFVQLLVDAAARGRVEPAAVAARRAVLSAATEAQLAVLADRRGYDLPTALLAATIDAYIRLHGFIAMEVFGQLRPITPKGGALFEEHLDDAVRRLGLLDTERDVTTGKRGPAAGVPPA